MTSIAAARAAVPAALSKRRTRRAAGAALAALLAGLLAYTSSAQQEPRSASPGASHPAIADVPAGPAAIRGRVVHASDPAKAGGVELVLYALPASGVPGLRRGRSGPDGSFAFERLSNDPATAYLVGARHDGIPFPGERVVFAAGELERRVDVPISDASRDAAHVKVMESQLRLDVVGRTLVASETHRLHNASEQVFYVPPDERNRARAALRTTLPAGAGELSLPLGVVPEGLVQQGESLAFFGPVYPGEQEITFSYPLAAPQAALTLRKKLGNATERAVLLVPAQGLSAQADALRAGEEVTLEGRRYRTLEAERVAAGTTLRVKLELAPVRQAPEAVSVAETRLFLELDAAALIVREEHRLHVSGDTAVAGTREVPLVRIELPDAAENLRFATTPPGLGLGAGDAGGLVVPGPLPAGDSTIELLYRLPVASGPSALERRFVHAMPLLSVYIADTGLAVESDRLHRRRPVRTEDRAYLHLEAFDIAAGERVALRLTPLPAARGLPRFAEIGLLALAAAGVVAFLAAPLQRGAAQPERVQEAPHERKEREAVYAAIHDLDHDFETGKLSAEDHRSLRDELRARALALLRAEREARGESGARDLGPAPPPPTQGCDACGYAARPGDRFCAHCGKPLAAASSTSGERSI